ncbi:MAG: hypothetical protein JST90_10090 [Bacteroidetes bacterium]|nr:hypothetical protein [Bacteroidota bacterium]
MISFCDFFQIEETVLDQYGAFNISLINDLPLFIDPFLLFASKKTEYKEIHNEIVTYLTFLRDRAVEGRSERGELMKWYYFPEVKENWLGYCLGGNEGSGLGEKFAKALSQNLKYLFENTEYTQSVHLEKAGLFHNGVGKDNISDFTTNLIKHYLCQYTETFSKKNINPIFLKEFNVPKAYFDYDLEKWMSKKFLLPVHPQKENEFILLTPSDILTKDDNWINLHDLEGRFNELCNAVPNIQLRSEISAYFKRQLPKLPKDRKEHNKSETGEAINKTLQQYPQLFDLYIGQKEQEIQSAAYTAQERVKLVRDLMHVTKSLSSLLETLGFYNIAPERTKEAALKRILFLKKVIEENDGYRLFYKYKQAITREIDLQIMYRLTWYASSFDVNREVNNGRGPVDYAISYGSEDKTLVEFKLARNTKLKQNLEKQLEIYKQASSASAGYKVIIYFTGKEYRSVEKTLRALSMVNDQNIILIDARQDNKISASNA